MTAEIVEVDDHKGHGSDSKGRKNRHRPFASVLLAGLLVVPVLALVLRLIAAASPGTLWLSTWLTLFAFGLVMPLVALGIGHKVTKRLPFVIWHIFTTLVIFGSWLSFTVQLSMDLARPWYARLWEAVALPGWWWVLHIVGALCLSGSWLLYRIDSLRSAAGVKGGGGTWEELFGKGVTARVEQAVITDTAIEVPLEHTGVPISQVRQGIAKVDEKPGVIAGKTTIVRDGKEGGRSVLRITTADPFDPSRWDWWPGPSHPGETYEAPICTAKYEDQKYEWFAFARTPDGAKFRSVAPYTGSENFASPSGTFLGRQGMTGAGKSGDACIEEAEVLSRRDVVLVHVAPAKLRQNAEWLLDMATLAAEGDRISLLFRALMKLGEYRDTVNLGRDFDSEVAARTGRPWVHIFADEFDITKQGTTLKWLLTKGRSLGFRFSFTLPRATGENMDTNIRGSIGAWKQFGISQDYDAGFVLSDKTLEAMDGNGAQDWGATVPGAHYLDMAPGVDPAKYPMPARTFKTRRDYADLRSKTLAARATFTPASFPPDELEVLGDVMEICNPLRLLEESDPPEPIRVNAQVSSPMEETLNLDDYDEDGTTLVTGDDDLDELLASMPPLEWPDGIDPRQPIAPSAGSDSEMLVLPEGKSKLTREETEKELDAAITRMAIAGRKEIGNKDIMNEMRCLMSPPDVSKRLKKLLDGEETVHEPAPGVLLKRVPGKAGAYVIHRL